MPRVAFRVDASQAVGAGHVVRCRALAAQLRQRGRTCHFVAGQGARPWSEGLRADGHTVDLIADASDWQDDAARTLRSLGDAAESGWLVVDHYGLDARWHQALREAGWRILAIDDLANRPLAADAVLDPAPTASADGYRSLAPDARELLLGPRYCLLRAEFGQLREQARAAPRRSGRVHLAFGGTDRGEQVAGVAAGLLQADTAVQVTVVVPEPSPALQQAEQQFRGRFALHVAPPSVAQTMIGCDVALGAPGGMLWERFCLGLPSACFAVSPNQREVLAALAAQHWLLDLGTPSSFATSLPQLLPWLRDRPARKADRERLMAAVDGQGAARVADWLIAHDA